MASKVSATAQARSPCQDKHKAGMCHYNNIIMQLLMYVYSQESAETRRPWVQAWHRAFRRFLSLKEPSSAKQFHPKYGRFPPSTRYNVDQCPLPFVLNHDTTLEEEGASRVWMAEPGGGALSKRQATLQLCLSADPERPQPRPAIIFRGKGLRITAEENFKLAWDRRVDVYFQENAWLDGNIAEEWVK